MALVGQMLKREWGEDLELFSLCLETGLGTSTTTHHDTPHSLFSRRNPTKCPRALSASDLNQGFALLLG